jgi:hypothetical protein
MGAVPVRDRHLALAIARNDRTRADRPRATSALSPWITSSLGPPANMTAARPRPRKPPLKLLGLGDGRIAEAGIRGTGAGPRIVRSSTRRPRS